MIDRYNSELMDRESHKAALEALKDSGFSSKQDENGSYIDKSALGYYWGFRKAFVQAWIDKGKQEEKIKRLAITIDNLVPIMTDGMNALLDDN